MDFFESKKSIDLIDISINQSSLQISTDLVPQQLSKPNNPNLELYQFVKIHVVQQHIQVSIFLTYLLIASLTK